MNNTKRNIRISSAFYVALVIGIVVVIGTLAITFNSGSFKRRLVDLKSEYSNGLNREINVYTADGKLLRHFEGKIDIEERDGGVVKFDLDGKRYIYYNCYVESIAEY